MADMWKKIGVAFKEYKRGQNAGILSMNEVFSPSERAQMQEFMDEVYGVFKKHVTDIRGKRLKKPIDELAGGRVFTGKQALELGLVDRIGTLSDAIAYAAVQVKIDEYDVRTVPEPKNFLEQLKEELTGGKPETGRLQNGTSVDSLINLAQPFLQNLDPQTMSAIISALNRLEILRREGVALSMPEIVQP
jgi:protease-4